MGGYTRTHVSLFFFLQLKLIHYVILITLFITNNVLIPLYRHFTCSLNFFYLINGNNFPSSFSFLISSFSFITLFITSIQNLLISFFFLLTNFRTDTPEFFLSVYTTVQNSYNFCFSVGIYNGFSFSSNGLLHSLNMSVV